MKAKAARISVFAAFALLGVGRELPMQPLILTLWLDDDSARHFNELRQRYFPRERNYLDAHVTLFHALPAESETQIRADLDEICARTPKFELNYPGPRFLGKGNAIEVESSELVQLRRELSGQWRDLLGAQDSRVIKPHITIQNKVTPDKARALFEKLTREWQPFGGRGAGLLLWRYRGGPWDAAGQWEFTG